MRAHSPPRGEGNAPTLNTFIDPRYGKMYNPPVSSLPLEACPACRGTGWARVSRDGVDGVVRCECLKVSRADRLLERANIPPRYSHCELESFDVVRSPGRSIEKAKLVAEKFVDEYPMAQPFGLLFMGPQGVGKTHLAVGIIKELMRRKAVQCLFRTFPELLNETHTSYNPVPHAPDLSLPEPVSQPQLPVS